METLNAPEHPNRNIVRKAIGFHPLAYENLIHKYFVTWCEEMALRFYHNDRQLIQDEMLHKYYQTQWIILVENRLMKDYGLYMKKMLPDTAKFYYKILSEYAEDLEKHYPAILVRQPQKSKTTTKIKYQFNNN